MPIDRFGESSNKESGVLSQISLLAVAAERPQPQTVSNGELLTLSFGASAAAVGASSDLLTNRVLQSLPKERAGISEWWRNNASGATKEMFAAHDARLLKLRLDQGLAEVIHKTAGLDYAHSAEQLRPHLANAKADLREFKRTPSGFSSGSVWYAPKTDRLRARELAEAAGPRVLKTPVVLPECPLGQYLALRSAEPLAIVVPKTLLPHPKGVEVWYDLMEKPFSALEKKGQMTAWHHGLEAQTLEGRVKTLQNLIDKNPAGNSALKTLGTETEELYRYKQFAKESPVGKLIETTVAKGEAQALAAREMEAARKALSTELALAPKMHGVPEQFASNAGRRLLAGAGLSALSMGAGYGFDKKIAPSLGLKSGADNELSNGTRLAVDGCLVPAFLLSEIPLKYRLPLAATAFSAGRAANLITADTTLSPEMAKLLTPNHADSILTGAAVMAPIGGRYKAAAITGALVTGRVVNMFY
ncbi:MAG: hypothetical protein K2W95_29715 [Candidatus Obscuribacterales bacterium]|nr:hypothetical protein [Candidatus Obscuribacterales bacterium]